MNLFENGILNIVIMLFPLLIYFFFEIYNDNFEKERQLLILDIALLSSIYLNMRYSMINNNISYGVLLNTILLIAYLKKREFMGFIISLILIMYYRYNIYVPLLLLFLEYFIYYILYKIKINSNNFIKLFIFIKILFNVIYYICYWQFELNDFIIIHLIIFPIVALITIHMINKCEEILKLHNNIQELEQEKQIRTSLFKITHEIKNPIAVCKSYLDMFDFNNLEHEKYIPIIKEEIEKILLLLQDFLSMNKIQIKKEILDVNYLLEDIINQFEPALKSKNITFIKELSDDEIYMEGDYNRLSQVMINLIKNSMEAMKDENRYLLIRSKKDGKSIVISVEDNGYGISKEDMKRIKEPFYTTKKNGTGLGVSLSCEIISAHKGKIRYISKENVGTKVIITLPYDSKIN